jgi:Holliday junction DNA helicase RuvA
MIKYLHGEITEKEIDEVSIDVAGVGYGVKISIFDYEAVQLGMPAKLYIHEHIKEDAYDLFGFLHVQTKNLFEQLLSVKNVGPKVAMAILGIGTEQTVREAIASGDVKRLQTAKGVGKRAAEQIVVELRDKVGLVASDEAEGVVNRGGVDMNDEAVLALVALGYSEYDAQAALKNTDPTAPTEERIKQALKGNRQ